MIIIKNPITNVLDAERRRLHLSERLMPWLLQDKVGALNLLQNVVLKFEPLTANYLHNEEEKKYAKTIVEKLRITFSPDSRNFELLQSCFSIMDCYNLCHL